MQNKKVFERVRKNVVYPDRRVVAFLARNFADKEQNRNKKALDIGFGSGRHIKLLLDYGFETSGIDYVQGCADITNWRGGVN